MSRRNRQRRSAAELLREVRPRLDWTDEEEEGDSRPQTPVREPSPVNTDTADTQQLQMEQLAAITQALQLAGRPSFKPPSFSGDGNVDLFVSQFEDVAEANHWSPLERTLHLRSQLTGDAQRCE